MSRLPTWPVFPFPLKRPSLQTFFRLVISVAGRKMAYSRSQAKEKTSGIIESHSSHLKQQKTKKLCLSALPAWAPHWGALGSVRANKHRPLTFPPALATPLLSAPLSQREPPWPPRLRAPLGMPPGMGLQPPKRREAPSPASPDLPPWVGECWKTRPSIRFLFWSVN